jgi:hypothetical protein
MIPSFSSRIKKSFGTLTTVFNVSCWYTAIGINGSFESSSGWSSDSNLGFIVVVNFFCDFLLIWVLIGFFGCCCCSSSPPCCSSSVRRPIYFFVDVDDGVDDEVDDEVEVEVEDEVEVEVEVDDSDV